MWMYLIICAKSRGIALDSDLILFQFYSATDASLDHFN